MDGFMSPLPGNGSGPTPNGNATASSSRLGRVTPEKSALKRKASGELPESSPAHPLRRSLIKSQISNTSLEAKVFALEQRIKQKDEDLESRRVEIEQLKQDRRNLNKGYTDALNVRDDVKAQFDSATRTHEKEKQKFGGEKRDLENAKIKVEQEYERLGRQHRQHVDDSQKKYDILKSQLSNTQEERDGLLHIRKQAHELSDALEKKDRELEDVRLILAAERERVAGSGMKTPSTGDEALGSELKRQAGMLSSLGKQNQVLQQEVSELRQRRDNVEMAKNETKALAKRAKAAEDKLSVVQDALDRARRDMDMLTINFPSIGNTSDDTTSSAAEVVSLQHRLSQLAAAHAGCQQTISARQSTILDYSNRLEYLSRESAITIDELEKRAEAAERELRWSNDARATSEKKLSLAREELEMLRSKKFGNSSANTGATAGEDQSARIAELEQQVELYRRTIDGFHEDSRDAQAKVILDLDLVKRSDMAAVQQMNERLSSQVTQLTLTITQHENEYEALRKEAEDMENRIGSGEYNTKVWRAIEFKGNPAAKDLAIRKETLDKLRTENEALVKQVSELQKAAGAGLGGGEGKSVPLEVYDRLQDEKKADQAAHEKRLMRLKEVFGMKSKEFLEAVFSLLGWRIKFDEATSDLRLTSMYAPRTKMGLTLVFKSQGGHFGTMKMMGAMSKTLEHVKDYWLIQRQSVPGFLAQVTLEVFEKTTVGRLAGYVGNDEVEQED